MSGHAVLNVEAIFALAVLGGLLWRSRSGGLDALPAESRRAAFDRSGAVCLVSIALLVTVVFWQASRIPFVSDDYVLMSFAEAFRGNYLPAFTHGGGDGFFRPFGYISIWWTWPWAGWDPARWHWAALALHAICAGLVYVVAVGIGLSRAGAWLASALFALHGSHPEAVVWIAGRFDLVATAFVLSGFAAFVRLWSKPSAAWGVAAGVALVTGILSKESAYALPLMMLVYTMTQPSGWSRRARVTAPYFAIAAILFVYRWILQGGIGGYLTASGGPQALSLQPVTLLESILVRMWAVLWFPIDWARGGGVGIRLAIVAVVLAWLLVMWRTEASRKALMLPLGLTLAAAVPALPLLLIGADLQKARVLYLPSAGFCLLAAAAVESVKGPLRTACGAAMLLFSLTALGHNLAIWEDVAAQSKAYCVAAAASCSSPESLNPPRSIDGVYFFANGLPECVRRVRAIAHQCPGTAK